MTLEPLLSASPAIQIHTVAALLALGLGLGQFTLKRGSVPHRLVGWGWVLLMVVTAGSSFFIHQIRLVGLWSPIHLLSVYTLIMLVVAVHAARTHRVLTHRYTMISLFVFALIGAGAFTLLPGRLMHAVLFS
ncbi:MAG: DUF2306 domain-containing protein [Ectothiorhodospiraceae bacterium]|nr:DUF2306 domain-containing protein [Ectothiorhodospiraceae bacterium]MCH8506328.1 DUF2306 domain-containing protein [Ectothiorhodospiraceae bacterium]